MDTQHADMYLDSSANEDVYSDSDISEHVTTDEDTFSGFEGSEHVSANEDAYSDSDSSEDVSVDEDTFSGFESSEHVSANEDAYSDSDSPEDVSANEDAYSDFENPEHVSDGSLDICSSIESVAGEVAGAHNELNLLSSEAVFSNCDERHSSYEKNTYQYIPLPVDSIRLFQIQLDESKMSLIMKSFSVAERPPYVALSYTWGKSDKVEIVVNGERKYVWKNLWRFLLQARRSMPKISKAESNKPSAEQKAQPDSIGPSTWLWVDALCIDQNNVKERNEQVLKMPHIYRDATCVIIWLGPAYSGSDAAIDKFNAGRHFSLVASRDGHDIAFSLMCDRRYWSRLWVFQEVILARHIIMLCGSRKVQWQRFRDFVLRVCDDTDSWNSRAARIIQDSPARQILSRTAHHPTDDICLLDLLLSTSDLKCADPRDRIYAMLGSSRKGRQDIVPDYSLPLPTLLNKVLRSHHLDFEPRSLDDVEEQCRRIDSVFYEQGSRESIFNLVGGLNEYHGSANFEKHALKRRNGRSSLWWAAYYKHEAVTKLLVQDPTVNPTAWLKQAVKDGDLAAVEVLWSHIAAPDSDLFNHAVYNGDRAMVKLLLKQGLTFATNGTGPLHRAAGKGDLAMVKLLLKQGLTFATTGEGPLHRAAENINVPMMKLLLNEGFTFGKISKSSSALRKASYVNRLEALELLLKHGFNPNTTATWEDTPLTEACTRGHIQAAQLLLDFGADPNHTHEDGTLLCDTSNKSSLSCASQAGHIAVVELLLSRGSNVNACTEQRVSLSHENANVDISHGWSPLYEAICGDHLEIINMLLRDGADVEQCCKQHTRLLQAACSRGSIDAVELLLEAGADINAWSKPHGTALHAAIEFGRFDVVTLLLDHNAGIDIATGIGTALHHAADKGHTQILALLLERGGNVRMSTKVGSPLHIAAVSGHLDSVRLLLDHGADPNFATEYGSPLHSAVENGNLDIVKLLIKCGANCSIMTRWGSPLHIAAEDGHIDIAKLLLDEGADINAVAPPGTPLDHAVDLKRSITADFLSACGAKRSGMDNESRKASRENRERWSKGPHVDKEVS